MLAIGDVTLRLFIVKSIAVLRVIHTQKGRDDCNDGARVIVNGQRASVAAAGYWSVCWTWADGRSSSRLFHHA